MKWRVCKTVTEYHYFVVNAESEQEAMDIVNGDHDLYYCDPDNLEVGMRIIDVVEAVEVKE